MALVNISKPTSSQTNVSKPPIGLTWAAITTTWASETHTWALVSQLFSNVARQIASMVNISKP